MLFASLVVVHFSVISVSRWNYCRLFISLEQKEKGQRLHFSPVYCGQKVIPLVAILGIDNDCLSLTFLIIYSSGTLCAVYIVCMTTEYAAYEQSTYTDYQGTNNLGKMGWASISNGIESSFQEKEGGYWEGSGTWEWMSQSFWGSIPFLSACNTWLIERWFAVSHRSSEERPWCFPPLELS